MSKFYTSVAMVGNNILVRGYEDGKAVSKKVPYKPYLFMATPNGDTKYRTLDGRPAGRIDFDSIKEARDFLNKYKDVDGMDVFGLNKYQYTYIYDNYKGMIDYDPSLVSVVSIDIEVDILNSTGFPDVEAADNEITLITISRNGKKSVFGCGDYEVHAPNIKYYKCSDEFALLQCFLEVWNSVEYSPEVVTGWNIEFFDIPYIVNRIMRVLGEHAAKKLSPWGYLSTNRVAGRNGEMVQIYIPVGVAILDYMHLYKKFAFKQQESYSLDHIANDELGEKKLDTSQYGGLAGLQRDNWQIYTEYNIRDVDLIDKLEDKLKLIVLCMSIAYDAKINYQDAFTTVGAWDVIIHNYLMDRCKVIPQLRVKAARDIMGGYVKEVQTGLHNWVVSLDLNSLYPHIIMQYNMSAETYRGKYPGSIDGDRLLAGLLNDPNNREILEKNNYSTTANGCLFDQSNEGFLPALMSRMYDDRVLFKKKMIECKKAYEALDDKTTAEAKQLVKDISRYDNAQMAKKIQLNAAYGAHANPYFRWFDPDFAEGITSSGQLTTRWIEGKLNEYLNRILKTDNYDYVIACDTDSVYICVDKLVAMACPPKFQHDKSALVAWLDKVCVNQLEPYIEECYVELQNYMNAGKQRMKMKRECIADKAIWTAKKRYILNVWNQEGVAYETPKLKMMGIEAIRTSTPALVRGAIKEALTVIMNKDETSLQTFVADFRDKFNTKKFEDVAFPRGVSDLTKYADASSIYKKGCPIAVRGALVYNHNLKRMKLDRKYEPIDSGSKIKFSYMKMPNPLITSVLSCPSELPKEFGMDDFIDYDMQFEKSFLEPIKTIVEAIGWEVEKRATLDSFFV